MPRILTLLFLLGFLASCDSSLKSELESHLGDKVGPSDPGLAVLVTRDSLILLEYCAGMADLDPRIPIGSSTNFRLASVTKQFTASAVLMLAAQGSLSLEQSLTDIFPDFPPYGSSITLSHLLTHTSGLADYESLIPDTTTIPVLDRDVLRLLATQETTIFAPGTQFRYSNSGYALLALVVEKVSGMRFADFLREKIFVPLGMAGTLAFENGISTVENRAYGHSRDGENEGVFLETDQSLTSSVLGDGGIYSSLEDLGRWAEELAHPTVLDPRLLAEAMSAQVATQIEGESYGYGWYVTERSGLRVIRHSGSTMGFRTELQRYPDLGLTIIVLANRADIAAMEIASRLADHIIRDVNE